jgi:glycosyltransferase involved in cell wall biosynthesis
MTGNVVGASLPAKAGDGVLGESPGAKEASILLVLPLPVKYGDGGDLLVESQAANGLDRWAENFDRVRAACILTPEEQLAARSSILWRPARELAHADRVEVIPLPWAFSPRLFLRHRKEVTRRLRDLIRQSRYLFFGISYTWGDWASLGGLEALRQRRAYAVWTDLVDHQVVRFNAQRQPLLRRLYRRHVDANLVMFYHHYLIRRCGLGLFHGRDCFDAYAPLCGNPHVVHNIHLKPHDAIAPVALAAKADAIEAGFPLRIGYVGRADASKGATDWLQVVKQLVDRGMDVRATWLGDGPLLEELRRQAQESGLGDRADFPGFEADRGKVLDFLRSLHILIFCHKVPESPRVLIESLVCGTPIVGYDSPYPRDLIGDSGWGMLTPLHDCEALVRAIERLERDRRELAAMVRGTSAAAVKFNDEAVFRHRSELIRAHL